MEPRELAELLGLPEPVHIGEGIWACSAVITPEMAQEIYTNHHISNNRNRKRAATRLYTSDMKAGRWYRTSQGLAFNAEGLLYDGQNRLLASIEAERPFPTIVLFGFSGRAAANTDSGVKRSLMDAAQILGVEVASTRWGSTVRYVACGAVARRLSNEETFAAGEVIEEAVLFVLNTFPSPIKHVTIQPVFGAIGRAYYHVDTPILARFCEVLRTGGWDDSQPHEQTAIRLVRLLNASPGGGNTYQKEIFGKTGRAVAAFVRGQDLRILREAKQDLYPLPKHVVMALRAKGVNVR